MLGRTPTRRSRCAATPPAVSRAVGNCYTAAVYMNLLSLVSNLGAELEGKRVLVFSYGSGAVATAFGLQARAVRARARGGARSAVPSHGVIAAVPKARACAAGRGHDSGCVAALRQRMCMPAGGRRSLRGTTRSL